MPGNWNPSVDYAIGDVELSVDIRMGESALRAPWTAAEGQPRLVLAHAPHGTPRVGWIARLYLAGEAAFLWPVRLLGFQSAPIGFA